VEAEELAAAHGGKGEQREQATRKPSYMLESSTKRLDCWPPRRPTRRTNYVAGERETRRRECAGLRSDHIFTSWSASICGPDLGSKRLPGTRGAAHLDRLFDAGRDGAGRGVRRGSETWRARSRTGPPSYQSTEDTGRLSLDPPFCSVGAWVRPNRLGRDGRLMPIGLRFRRVGLGLARR
jgi:hypothetical protein